MESGGAMRPVNIGPFLEKSPRPHQRTVATGWLESLFQLKDEPEGSEE
jgi:hypothetical protein